MTMCTTGTSNPVIRAQPLLHPDRLVSARDVLADGKLIPDAGGVYGWWFNVALPGVPLDGTLAKDGYRLLYLGIAPQKPSVTAPASKSTLRKRIVGNHLGAHIASSTLRRSLAWLLKPDMDFAIARNAAGKQVMPGTDEATLTAWMRDHAALSFVVDSEPWLLEDELIAHGPSLPINIRGSTHPFGIELSKMRGGMPAVFRA